MAYEAMNNAGALQSRLIVILNDNDMSIAPPTGAMSRLSRTASRPARRLLKLRDVGKTLAPTCSSRRRPGPPAPSSTARTYVTGGTLFEELGFYYVGPIDGHNLDHMLPILKNVRTPIPAARC